MKDTLTILKDAYALIRNKDNWITRYASRDQLGRVVNPWEDDAVKFCAAGAVWKASGANIVGGSKTVSPIFDMLKEALDGEDIAYVNDGPDGHARVCEGFRDAIASLTPVEEKTPELTIA